MAEKKRIATQLAEDQVKSAPRALLEELFEDYYKNRHQLYWMNFIRGIFFGFGTVIGGTIVVALLLWVLSALEYIPFIEDIVEAAQKSLQQRQ